MSSNALVGNAWIVNPRFGVAALMALIVAGSCSGRATGKGVLPPPNSAAVTPSPYQPERPFDLQADGVLSRPVFRTEESVPVRAEIVDVLIPPGKATTLKHEGWSKREGTGAGFAGQTDPPPREHSTFSWRPRASRTAERAAAARVSAHHAVGTSRARDHTLPASVWDSACWRLSGNGRYPTTVRSGGQINTAPSRIQRASHRWPCDGRSACRHPHRRG
jgi:hypothetical protein